MFSLSTRLIYLLLTIPFWVNASAQESVENIYQAVKTYIEQQPHHRPSRADFATLNTFLQSKYAEDFIQKTYRLSPYEKTELFKKISNTAGGDFTWMVRRNHLACLITQGVDPDTTCDVSENFLGKSVLHDDTEGVEFIVPYQPKATTSSIFLILDCVKSEPTAKLLLTLP